MTPRQISARLKVLIPTEDFPSENRTEVRALRGQLLRKMQADGQVVIVGCEVLQHGPPEDDLT